MFRDFRLMRRGSTLLLTRNPVARTIKRQCLQLTLLLKVMGRFQFGKIQSWTVELSGHWTKIYDNQRTPHLQSQVWGCIVNKNRSVQPRNIFFVRQSKQGQPVFVFFFIISMINFLNQFRVRLNKAVIFPRTTNTSKSLMSPDEMNSLDPCAGQLSWSQQNQQSRNLCSF